MRCRAGRYKPNFLKCSEVATLHVMQASHDAVAKAYHLIVLHQSCQVAGRTFVPHHASCMHGQDVSQVAARYGVAEANLHVRYIHKYIHVPSSWHLTNSSAPITPYEPFCNIVGPPGKVFNEPYGPCGSRNGVLFECMMYHCVLYKCFSICPKH